MLRIFSKLNSKEIVLLILYSLVILGLFLYSFTQIDLSLTFSRNEVLSDATKWFQQIGYFNRPLSAYLYISIVILLFIFYVLFLFMAHKKKIGKSFVWCSIIVSTVLLAISYNAFSYDIFNYIFDAKIVTNYHENPYEHKALDYPTDPMLSFMRWTHRVYPYGPAWLGLTVPLSFIGMQIFLVTYFLFKILMAVSFIGCIYFTGKIFQKLAPDKEVFGLVFLALNPLVLIESLVSAHLDIVMMFFSTLALYYLIHKRHIYSYISLGISIAIKFVTGFVAPVFLLIHFIQSKGIRIKWNFMFTLFLLLMIVGVIVESYQSNFQPWYLLAILPFAVFVGHNYFVLLPTIIITFTALMNYVPFLYVGNWDKPIPQILSDMNFFSYCFSFFVVALLFGYNQIVFAKTVKKNKHVVKK